MDIGTLATPDVVGHRIGAELESIQRGASPQEAGRKLAALFATMLMRELRRSLPNEGFFGEGPGADIYNGWFDQHIADALSASGALELAGMLKTVFVEQEPGTREEAR